MLPFQIQTAVVAVLLGAPSAPREDAALAALIEEALSQSPMLGATGEAVLRAEERPSQAGALEDPMFSFSYQNDGWAPSLGQEIMTLLRFGLAQDLPYPGKRELRRNLALKGVESMVQARERARLDLVASVERSYFGLVEARALLALLDEEEALWRQTEAVARSRYSVGQGVQQDVLRVQIELTRLEERRAMLDADVSIRSAELNALVGRPAGEPVESARELVLEPLSSAALEVLEAAREKSPELAAARIAIEEARLEVALAEKERKPDFRLGGAYMNRGGLPPMWEAAVDVSLPVRGEKRDAAVAEAKALDREAALRLESVELALRFRTEERQARLKSQERIAALYLDGVIPQNQLSVEAALASYRVGNVPFVTVLEALSRLYLDRALHVRTLALHAVLRSELESASLEPMR
jgi:outer membrane protein TolC